MSSTSSNVSREVSLRSLSTSAVNDKTNVDISAFSRGKKILIFAVIGILILVIVAMVVLLVFLLRSSTTSNQSKESTHFFNGQTQPTTKLPAQIYDVGSGGASGGSPCLFHTVINDPSRNVNHPGYGGTCDSGPFFNTTIGGRWIRFIGTGGTVLPSYSPGVSHCGAYLAMWANTTLPTAVNTTVDGTACIDSAWSIGFSVIPIKIGKCADFYVYFLPPAMICSARYCTV